MRHDVMTRVSFMPSNLETELALGAQEIQLIDCSVDTCSAQDYAEEKLVVCVPIS